MGSIALTALLPGVHAQVDEAREITGFEFQQNITAMYVKPAESLESPLIYAGEIPIFVSMPWRVVEYGEKHRARWWRLEFQVSRRQDQEAAIRRGQHLVVAWHPYSFRWVQSAPFKPANRHGPEERPDPVGHPFDSAEQLIEWLENLPYDFWETGNYLTAGLSLPERPFGSIEDVRNLHGKTRWVVGVCDDFPACVNALWATEEVKLLLKKTGNGTLDFWPVMVDRPARPLWANPVLFDELTAAAPSLMWLAIRQALAGPHKESQLWLGRPVVHKINHIYREHVYNCYRDLGGEMGQGRRVS